MDNNFLRGYQAYLNHFQQAMGNIPPPSYSEHSDVNQNQHSRQETPSPVGFQQQEAHQSQQNETSQHSVESDINEPSKSKGRKRQRWSSDQTNVLVKKWKEYFDELESSRQYSAWLKIKSAVDEAGPTKSIKQCKDKLRNLKDAYKLARDNNKRTGASPNYSPFYDDFDEIFGSRDCVNMPFVTEVGTATSQINELGPESEQESVASDQGMFFFSGHIVVKRCTAQHPIGRFCGYVFILLLNCYSVYLIDIVSPVSSGKTMSTPSSLSSERFTPRTKNDDSFESESDDEFNRMVAAAKKSKKPKTKGKEKSQNAKLTFQQELLGLQKEQMKNQKQQEDRHEKFLRDMMEEQRRIEREERDKDRDFFLKLGQMFSGKGS